MTSLILAKTTAKLVNLTTSSAYLHTLEARNRTKPRPKTTKENRKKRKTKNLADIKSQVSNTDAPLTRMGIQNQVDNILSSTQRFRGDIDDDESEFMSTGGNVTSSYRR